MTRPSDYEVHVRRTLDEPEQFNSQFNRQPDKDQDADCDKAALKLCGVAAALIAAGIVVWWLT